MNDTGVRVPSGFDSFGPWFTEAFELLKAQWQTWVLMSLIYLLIAGGMGYLLSRIVMPLGSIVSIAAAALMMPGMLRTAIRQMRGEAISVGDIFSATDMFVGALLILLLMYAGVIACGIGILVTSTLFYLALPLLVDKGIPFGQALSQSIDVVKQNFWFFLVYMLVLGIVAEAGVIACGIGVFLTMPMAFLGMAVAYEHTFNAPAIAPEVAPEPPVPPAA
jgi:uncharacterized membrane protein